ncbi:unnamed protein product [Polarella glacialis]|uniref:Uncharacterized protein n=1 Tax=Polarella glacialis TaxID=89957 RepID=A0A813JH50_POLGL|nr:unnamed protein product [Polarella glacialis]CAE8681690.1 unnamed protein product [Polarella glacialis]
MRAVPPATAGGVGRCSGPDEGSRFWEVLRPQPVRWEPHLDARVLGTKRKGQRVACSEITFDGWLKLADEQGWMISDMQGIGDMGAVMRPANDHAIQLAIQEPQLQGICCLEVVYSQAAVRSAPSRDAPALCYRRKGEYVFARSQNFDGWLRLAGEDGCAGEDGWMLTFVPDHGTLLQPRLVEATIHLDLWALSDVWAGVRRLRRMLSPQEVAALKEAEEGVLLITGMDFEHHVLTGNAGPLVEDKVLLEEDLQRPEPWIRQRLFANTLHRMALEEPPLSNLLPADFKLTPRPPPLEFFRGKHGAHFDEPLDDLDVDGFAGAGSSSSSRGGRDSQSKVGTSESTREVFPAVSGGRKAENHEHVPGVLPQVFSEGFNGGYPAGLEGMFAGMRPNDDSDGFLVTQDGFVIDPLTQQPVGMLNPETGEFEELDEDDHVEVVMLQLGGKPCIMAPDGVIYDVATQAPLYRAAPDGVLYDIETDQPVGVLNLETQEVDPVVVETESVKNHTRHSFGFDDEPLSAFAWAERARELVTDDYFHQAASAFGEALKCCESERAVELDFECELLRGRAGCWRRVREFKSLLKDAEQLLVYDATDAEALEWRSLARRELGI